MAPRGLLGFDGPILIGVVHLPALPGAPRPVPMDVVLDRARADARTWFESGADAVLVENFGDAPFHPVRVPPVTVAAMARAIERVRSVATGPVGVNVLRNDAESALGLCSALELDFLRVNVHSGVTVTDQGLIEGRAHESLRRREEWPGHPLLLADLDVKHGRPLVSRPVGALAEELIGRAGADALLLTGEGTGRPVDLEVLDELGRVVPEAPVLLASGVDPDTVRATRNRVSGWIVGTWAKQGGKTLASLDPQRVAALSTARGRD